MDSCSVSSFILDEQEIVGYVGECSVCCYNKSEELVSLDCGHLFCRSCWQSHIDIQLQNGLFLKF